MTRQRIDFYLQVSFEWEHSTPPTHKERKEAEYNLAKLVSENLDILIPTRKAKLELVREEDKNKKPETPPEGSPA